MVALALIRYRGKLTVSAIARAAAWRATDLIRWAAARDTPPPPARRMEAHAYPTREVDVDAVIRPVMLRATPRQREIVRALLACGSIAAAAKRLKIRRGIIDTQLTLLRKVTRPG